MRLYVMRHGPAEDRAPTGRDFDRALTRAGREVVHHAATELQRALGALAGPLRVLSSPLRRARETAEIVVGVLAHAGAPGAFELHDDLAADTGVPLRLVQEIAAAGTDTLLVGHQPTVEDLARMLLHPRPLPLPGGFRTATVLALERVAADRDAGWRPAWVVDPHLRAG